MKTTINWSQLAIIVLFTELVGILSGLLSGNSRQIFLSLEKPPLSPPGWAFGIVWLILYCLMGIAFYIIYQTPETPERKKASVLYWTQLFINFTWPIIFFRFNMYWLAVLVILLLDILVLATTLSFYKIKPLAALLMIPYLLWVLFATYLNIGIAILN